MQGTRFYWPTMALRRSNTSKNESRRRPPLRALVTDVQLGPGPSGWEIAKRARELHPEIPVVYVTGTAAAEWSSKGVPNSLIIQKPFAAAQVVTAVSQLLNAPPTATPAA